MEDNSEQTNVFNISLTLVAEEKYTGDKNGDAFIVDIDKFMLAPSENPTYLNFVETLRNRVLNLSDPRGIVKDIQYSNKTLTFSYCANLSVFQNELVFLLGKNLKSNFLAYPVGFYTNEVQTYNSTLAEIKYSENFTIEKIEQNTEN